MQEKSLGKVYQQRENWLSILYTLFTNGKNITKLIYRTPDSDAPDNIFAVKNEDGVTVFLESFDEPVTLEKWSAVQQLGSWCPVSYVSKETNEVHHYDRFSVPL